MNLQLSSNDILKCVNEAKPNVLPQWKTDLLAARLEIVSKLLVYSYHAIGLPLPTDEVILIRSAQISDNADICNRDIKAAFKKAMDVKMEKDIRTPITYGDLNRAARLVAEECSSTIVGKWKKALPKIEDAELWGDNVIAFAQTHGKEEFEQMRLGYAR